MTRPSPSLAEEILPDVRRVLAPNPGPMTYWGTNTYIVGQGNVAVVDPGPDDEEHLSAVLRCIEGAEVAAILVTHAHSDHSALSGPLASKTGAPVMAFGPPEAGRSPIMRGMAERGLTGGGEGVDTDFCPEQVLGDGDNVDVGGCRIEVLHTPGHFAGHLSFRVGEVLLCGDHAMDFSTTLISPPDGDVAAFMATTRRLLEMEFRILLPGHGPPIANPVARLEALLSHRMAREHAIMNAVSGGAAKLPEITRRVYIDTPAHLLPAAERNTFAHLIDLTQKSRIAADPHLAPTATFRIV